MKTKPYSQPEEEIVEVNEPAVAYGSVAAFEAFMDADLNEMGENFRPFTMSELNQWMDEVEAESDDDAIPHEEVMRDMRELILSYGH